jgi:uncharacterized membrane protein
MSPLADHVPAHQDSRRNFWQGSWPSIVRTIVLEILLLLALAGALVYYLNWSSEAALSEFMATDNPPLQAAKEHPSCRRSA